MDRRAVNRPKEQAKWPHSLNLMVNLSSKLKKKKKKNIRYFKTMEELFCSYPLTKREYILKSSNISTPC